MNKLTYFTFQEILNLDSVHAPSFPHRASISSTWFTDMLASKGLQFDVFTLDESFSNALINNIVNALMTTVYNRNAFNYLFSKVTSWNEDATLENEDFEKAMLKVINVINLTLPRYIPLLQVAEKASANLIAPNRSTTYMQSRFNDTPQDGGLYADDNHTTNLNEGSNTQELEIGTVMDRLDEAFKNFRPIILEWSNEFRRCFLLESQIK